MLWLKVVKGMKGEEKVWVKVSKRKWKRVLSMKRKEWKKLDLRRKEENDSIKFRCESSNNM